MKYPDGFTIRLYSEQVCKQNEHLFKREAIIGPSLYLYLQMWNAFPINLYAPIYTNNQATYLVNYTTAIHFKPWGLIPVS